MCGLFTSKDILSSRWINAEIDDATDRRWIVHVKYSLGGYFLADLEGRLYCFKLGKTKILKHTMTRRYEFVNYTTDNYMPIDPSNIKLLEFIKEQNSLPKINKNMLDVMSLLAKREKNLKQGEKFTGHDIKQLIDDIMQEQDRDPERARNLKTFLEELNTLNVVTPLRKVSDFLDNEVKVTDPKFLADISTQHQRTELEAKVMQNRPVKGGKSMTKLILVLMIAGLAIGVGIYLLQSGQLSHFSLFPQTTSGGGGSSGTVVNIQDLASKYPTPDSMIKAIKAGELDCKSLAPDIVKMVNTKTAGTCP